MLSEVTEILGILCVTSSDRQTDMYLYRTGFNQVAQEFFANDSYETQFIAVSNHTRTNKTRQG